MSKYRYCVTDGDSFLRGFRLKKDAELYLKTGTLRVGNVTKTLVECGFKIEKSEDEWRVSLL